MSRKKQKRKRPGHYCWVCESYRSNEKFSGRGHARHVCRECAKLGGEELAYRQAMRNLHRCLSWEGFIRRKSRKSFEQFLQHDNPRVRAYAERILKWNHAKQAYSRTMRELDDLMVEEEFIAIGLVDDFEDEDEWMESLDGDDFEAEISF